MHGFDSCRTSLSMFVKRQSLCVAPNCDHCGPKFYCDISKIGQNLLMYLYLNCYMSMKSYVYHCFTTAVLLRLCKHVTSRILNYRSENME